MIYLLAIIQSLIKMKQTIVSLYLKESRNYQALKESIVDKSENGVKLVSKFGTVNCMIVQFTYRVWEESLHLIQINLRKYGRACLDPPKNHKKLFLSHSQNGQMKATS